MNIWKVSHDFFAEHERNLNRRLKVAIVIGMAVGSPIGIVFIIWMVEKGWIN